MGGAFGGDGDGETLGGVVVMFGNDVLDSAGLLEGDRCDPLSRCEFGGVGRVAVQDRARALRRQR
jgi:hypothetical protein